MRSFFQQLNSAQKKAVKDDDQIVLVKAGPGTGKTMTLVAKINYLLSTGVQTGQITAITFTRRAAQEIKNRIKTAVGDTAAGNLNLGTFHSLAVQLLDLSQLDLVTDIDQWRMMQALVDNLKLEISADDALLAVSQIKNDHALLSQVSAEISELYQSYQQQLKSRQQIDYDDLLLRLLHKVKISSFSPSSYLLIDEFQDVSPLQYQIAVLWAKQGRQLFAIGDPRQAIYGFRGASAASFDKLKQDFSRTSSHNLVKNYRSRQEILTVAGRLFPQEKELLTQVETPGQTQLIRTLNQFTEADWIVDQIEAKLGGSGLISASNYHQQTGALFKDFAIVYRLHQLGSEIEKKIKQAGWPYQKVGKDSLYSTNSVQLLINLWRIAAATVKINQAETDSRSGSNQAANSQENHPEDQFWTALLTNKFLDISYQTIDKLLNYQNNEQIEWSALLNQSAAGSSLQAEDQSQVRKILQLYEQTIKAVEQDASLQKLLTITQQQLNLPKTDQENWTQLRVDLMQFEDEANPLLSFLDYFSTLKQRNFYDQQADKISLLSMHAAKGLEFDWIYLLGFEQDIIPLQLRKKQILPVEKEKQQQEEKNLLYVALTRAKKGFFLLTTENRWQQKQQLSSFLAEIEGEPLIEKTDPQTSKLKQKQQQQREKKRQKKLF